MKKIVFILTGLLSVHLSDAQVSETTYPVIGRPMPEFSLNDVHHYSKKIFDIADLKGKWTIMDFWTKHCSACVQSFPKINQLQNEFKEQIQFLLVAKNNKRLYGNTPQIYDRYRKNLGLQLFIAYDSVTFDKFGIQGVPHVIVIDPQANVYAVTDSYFLTSENLRNLVNGNKPAFRKKYSTLEETPASSYHEQWKYLLSENEHSRDFLYRSILSENQGEPRAGSWNIDQNAKHGLYQITQVNLYQLYNIAWWGESEWNRWSPLYTDHWTYPVLEISDSSYFQFDYLEGKELYNYSLTLPKEKATKAQMMELMQRDLKNYFSYEVVIETRIMPCWKLTATEEARKALPTKSGFVEDKRDPTGINSKKIPIGIVLSQIEEYNMDEHVPFIDETNIKGMIDISYSAVMTDMTDIVSALRKHGLILEKSKKEMKVLVIRDPKSPID